MQKINVQGIMCYDYEKVTNRMTKGEMKHFRNFMRTRELMFIEETCYIYKDDLSNWQNAWNTK